MKKALMINIILFLSLLTSIAYILYNNNIIRKEVTRNSIEIKRIKSINSKILETKNNTKSLKSITLLKKRISTIERTLLTQPTLKNDTNNKDTPITEKTVFDNEYEEVSFILEKAIDKKSFTLDDITRLNKLTFRLSTEEQAEIGERMMALIRSGEIQMPTPHPSEVQNSNLVIEKDQIPDDAIILERQKNDT